MPKKVLKEVQYKVLFNDADGMLIGFNNNGVSAIYAADLDGHFPLTGMPKGISVRKATLIVYDEKVLL